MSVYMCGEAKNDTFCAPSYGRIMEYIASLCSMYILALKLAATNFWHSIDYLFVSLSRVRVSNVLLLLQTAAGWLTSYSRGVCSFISDTLTVVVAAAAAESQVARSTHIPRVAERKIKIKRGATFGSLLT